VRATQARLLAITTVTIVSACGGGKSETTPDASAVSTTPVATPVIGRVDRWLLAVDGTASTNERALDVRADLEREIGMAYSLTSGVGAYLTVADFAGGPGDVQSIDDFNLCRDGKRQCTDSTAQTERLTAMVGRVSTLLADKPTVGGSDPVGFLYHYLATIKDGFEENPTRVIVWTDFVSRSDVVVLDGTTDLSSREARAAVVENVADKGLDFARLDLSGVTIEVRLIPTDVSSDSAVYAEHLRAFAEELLSRTGATVTVSLFTSTIA
jgi:hypothetical protein